jgi:hypothetical protein
MTNTTNSLYTSSIRPGIEAARTFRMPISLKRLSVIKKDAQNWKSLTNFQKKLVIKIYFFSASMSNLSFLILSICSQRNGKLHKIMENEKFKSFGLLLTDRAFFVRMIQKIKRELR